MSRSQFGVLVGLFLGLALAFGSFGDMVVVALFGAIGYVVMKVADGELDVTQYLSRGDK